MNETNYEFKIALIGSTNAGKSTLLERYINNKFQNLFATIGVNTTLKDVNIIVKKGNKIQEQLKVTLRISDTAGQERFRSLAPVYIKNAHCIIFVIDLFSQNDYKEFNYWLKEINDNIQSKSFLVICGTKIDLDDEEQRVFALNYFEHFVKNKIGYYFETSSKLNTGINEMFYFIAEQCYYLFHEDILKKKNQQIKQLSNNNNKGKICC